MLSFRIDIFHLLEVITINFLLVKLQFSLYTVLSFTLLELEEMRTQEPWVHSITHEVVLVNILISRHFAFNISPFLSKHASLARKGALASILAWAARVSYVGLPTRGIHWSCHSTVPIEPVCKLTASFASILRDIDFFKGGGIKRRFSAWTSSTIHVESAYTINQLKPLFPRGLSSPWNTTWRTLDV